MVNNELHHAGVKGMKWGQRLYQNKDGSLTPLGRLRYGQDGKTGASGKGGTNGKESTKPKKKEESLEEKKERILRSNDAETIYKNRHLFNDKEIQGAYNRLNNERNIKNLIPEKVSKGKKFIDWYCDASKTTKNVVDASDDFYKSVEKGMNLINKIMEKNK